MNLTATQAAYRRVARGTGVSGGCVGGRNTNDYTFVQLLWDDGLGFGDNIFVHPQYATFSAYSTIGSSWYNAFQLSARKRFQNGLTFDVHYTYSHSIDTASGNESSGAITGGASVILNPLDLDQNRGNSDFDVRHLINANYVYELPFGKGKSFFGGSGRVMNAIFGGWTSTGIFRWNTGYPAENLLTARVGRLTGMCSPTVFASENFTVHQRRTAQVASPTCLAIQQPLINHSEMLVRASPGIAIYFVIQDS